MSQALITYLLLSGALLAQGKKQEDTLTLEAIVKAELAETWKEIHKQQAPIKAELSSITAQIKKLKAQQGDPKMIAQLEEGVRVQEAALSSQIKMAEAREKRVWEKLKQQQEEQQKYLKQAQKDLKQPSFQEGSGKSKYSEKSNTPKALDRANATTVRHAKNNTAGHRY